MSHHAQNEDFIVQIAWLARWSHRPQQNSKLVQIDLTLTHLQASHVSRHRCARKKRRSSIFNLSALHVDLTDAVA